MLEAYRQSARSENGSFFIFLTFVHFHVNPVDSITQKHLSAIDLGILWKSSFIEDALLACKSPPHLCPCIDFLRVPTHLQV